MTGGVGAGADMVVTEAIRTVPTAPVTLFDTALPFAGGQVVGGAGPFESSVRNAKWVCSQGSTDGEQASVGAAGD